MCVRNVGYLSWARCSTRTHLILNDVVEHFQCEDKISAKSHVRTNATSFCRHVTCEATLQVLHAICSENRGCALELPVIVFNCQKLLGIGEELKQVAQAQRRGHAEL